MSSFLGLILFGFGLGVVAVVVLEAVGFLWIMKRLRHKIVREEAELSTKAQLGTASKQLDHQQSLHFAFNKQGVVWVLESGRISKLDKPSRDPKGNTELLEVSPIKMYGQVKGGTLILREPDGSHTTVALKGCTVQAVSASILSSRKW